MQTLQDIHKSGKQFANRYLLRNNKGRRGFVDLWEVSDYHTGETKLLQIFDEQYILIKLIGKGGFSEVWLAQDSVSLLEFAIKIYSQTDSLDEDGIQEFRKEFAMMCELNNSNLLHPQTFNITGRYPYIVLPYCKNGSANDLIGRMTEEELWRFISDVSNGLSYLHSRETPIIHRDIKPLNILINNQHQYLISDFGISTNLRKAMSKTQKDVIGTLQYMGAECHPRSGETKVPKPIISNDIWSFGATLYELATGSVPFGDYGGLTQRSVHKVPEIKKNYSPKLKNLIYLCLSEEPWNRPSADEIYKIAHGMKPIPSPTPFSRIKKIILASVFFVLLLLAIFAVYKSDWGGNPPKPPYQLDSLMLSKINEANAIVIEQCGRTDRYDNFAAVFIQRISDAVLLKQQAMSLNVSDDSVKYKAEKSWEKSQELINNSYIQLDSMERYYRSIPVISVADSFAKRRIEMEKYITSKTNNR